MLVFPLITVLCFTATVAEITHERQMMKTVVQTPYLKVVYAEEALGLLGISADFLGQSNYGVNLLTQPFQLEVSLPSSDSKVTRKEIKSDIWNNLSNRVSNKFATFIDSKEAFVEEWEIGLNEETRSFTVTVSGSVLTDITVNSLLYSIYVNNPSIYGLFEHGSFQMMNQEHSCLGTDRDLTRAYFIGNGGSLDVQIQDHINPNTKPENVFISNTDSSYPYKAAIQHVIAGHYPSIHYEMELAWSKKCWENVQPVTLTAGTNWSVTFEFTPNNYDFPAYSMNDITNTKDNVEFLDLASSFIGIYGSPMGCIQSYYKDHDGMISPTIAHPDVGYSPLTNFFDPDNFISLSALMYSNDKYLVKEVKKILYRTGQTMCGVGNYSNPIVCNSNKVLKKDPSKKEYYEIIGKNEQSSHYGQIMHHFDRLLPDYNSIAGSVQLGPNIFWTLSCLRFISITQDNTFAQNILPYIEASTQFLLSFYNEEIHLIDSPGPLWIDVFVRENYTSDSNAMLIPYLQEVAIFYEYMQYEPERYNAATLRQISEDIKASINQYLWNKDDNDHYITQMNLDLNTTRDFIDYDANLIALAFGVVDDNDKAKRIFERIDSNPFSHARATWVSEKEYTGDPEDCYSGPVSNGLCGDSNMTMARIGWVDSLARKRYDDKDVFENLLLKPLQIDLMNNIWLTERYNENGEAIRTPYYFEYASLVPIMLREVSYGIHIGLLDVTINPLVNKEFNYNVGRMKIYYHQKEILIQLPDTSISVDDDSDAPESRVKQTNLHSLLPNSKYQVKNECSDKWDLDTVMSNEEGLLSFPMKYDSLCEISVRLRSEEH